jgi:hypothetical protein
MPTIVTADPDVPLEAVNAIIEQQEQILGPLVSIGNDGKVTFLTFDLDREPPDKHAMVAVGTPRRMSPRLLRAKSLLPAGSKT